MANNATIGTLEQPKSLTRYIPAVARSLLGLIFVVFGLNGFFHFIPQPPLPDAAGAFAFALFKTGYFLPLLKGVEIAAGALLLSNRFVPLALAVLAPIAVHILAFHLFLGGGLVLALGVLVLEIYLAWAYRAAFRPMLQAKTSV